MQGKGTILIVDDHIDEKIGVFQEYLKIDGYTIITTSTLEEADRNLSNLLANNSIDGIILDFSFPIDSKDPSVHVDGIPNGVSLFNKHQFKIRNKQIPVIINTTGDEEYKRKHIGDLTNLGTPVYDVNNEANSLAQPNPELVKEVLKMFNERTNLRISTSNIETSNKLRTGKSIIQRPDGGLAYSRYDGD